MQPPTIQAPSCFTHTRALVLTDGNGFTTIEAIEALKQSIWGERHLPHALSKRLTQDALDQAAQQNPSQTWKQTLKDYRKSLALSRPARGFWSQLMNRKAAGLSEQTLEFVDQLLADLESHKAITKSNRNSYGGSNDAESSRRIFWPNPTYSKHPRNLFDESPLGIKHPLVTKTTGIVSAGSCFAMEIAHWLQDNGFNYIVTDKTPGSHRLPISSARWGTLFNAPSFRQMVEHAFGIRSLPKLLWQLKRPDGSTVLADPFREDVIFNNVEEWEADYEPHRANARKALEMADIFIMTLGMAEVWFTRHTKFYCSRCNWGLASELVDKKLLTVEDTVSELEVMLGILRTHNPKVKIIISASPVPLHATFRSNEMSVITANGYSKAVQRISAETFASRNSDVYYFPSYESVMHCTPNAWDADQRHVSRAAVDKVMKLFCDTFVDAPLH